MKTGLFPQTFRYRIQCCLAASLGQFRLKLAAPSTQKLNRQHLIPEHSNLAATALPQQYWRYYQDPATGAQVHIKVGAQIPAPKELTIRRFFDLRYRINSDPNWLAELLARSPPLSVRAIMLLEIESQLQQTADTAGPGENQLCPEHRT